MLILAVVGGAASSIVFALPTLRAAVRDIGRMSPSWVVGAILLELASCASFGVIFRAFFPEAEPRTARRIAWVEVGSGALLPAGGVSSYALGATLLRRTGMAYREIVVRSGGLFWLTTAVNAIALVIGSVLLISSGSGTFLDAGLPLMFTVVATVVVLVIATRAARASSGWGVPLGEGVHAAVRSVSTPSWRLVGAAGYLAFDMAVLWAVFRALGHAPSAGVLILGYLIGYVATGLPVPGDLGVLEGGLAGTLIFYGSPAAPTIAAVLVYHAIVFSISAAGGLLAYSQLRSAHGPRAVSAGNRDRAFRRRVRGDLGKVGGGRARRPRRGGG
jgi:uncharacterized membrane protein YbhN (UPF0104 family)